MTCPKCQFQNPEETLVCQNCNSSVSKKKNWWKKRFGKKVFLYSTILIVLVTAGFLSFRFLGISKTLKCRPVKVNIIKVNRNIEPQQGVPPQVWKGITLGNTTIQDAKNILKDQITNTETAAGKTMLYLGKDRHGVFLPSILIDSDGTVEKMFTIEPPLGYNKSQLVAEYGEPEGVVFGYPRYAPDVMSNDTFIYSSRGLAVAVSRIVDAVDYFDYFEPMSMEKFIITLGKEYERSISKCDNVL